MLCPLLTVVLQVRLVGVVHWDGEAGVGSVLMSQLNVGYIDVIELLI